MMTSWRAALLRIAGFGAGARTTATSSAELDAHLQFHIDDNVRAGMTPDEARAMRS